MRPLSQRRNKIRYERERVDPAGACTGLSAAARAVAVEAAAKMRTARAAGAPVILAFGAHLIKNCLGEVLQELMAAGWVTHLATNGAGVIHDWEFAFQGETAEDVRANVAEGCFGTWEETGRYLNLAIAVGAAAGLGYGESVGAMIAEGGLEIPDGAELEARVRELASAAPEAAAGAADLLAVLRSAQIRSGAMRIPHPWARFSVQARAWRLGIPFTGHPMIGHDIIYTHPLNHGGAVGRAAMRDFLTFAEAVSRLEGGVYLSVGSAVMSPMIFEKALSMGRNIAVQEGRRIEDFLIAVVDLAPCGWDWGRGEPPPERAEYYLRYNKTFSRMGGALRYACADNRDFLPALWQALNRGEA